MAIVVEEYFSHSAMLVLFLKRPISGMTDDRKSCEWNNEKAINSEIQNTNTKRQRKYNQKLQTTMYVKQCDCLKHCL
jgi:hypothetical protein